jgi:hypothetical protein
LVEGRGAYVVGGVEKGDEEDARVELHVDVGSSES